MIKTPQNALPPGTELYEYIIISVIGEGGFGIVYLARDTLLNREVAIKEFLPSSIATRVDGPRVDVRAADKREMFQRGLKRFVSEAQILARFRHPGLVSVLRFFQENNTAYMVMPYYKGRTLREIMHSGYQVKSDEDLLSILLPVLEGLAQIHSVNCYHLDISPDNIILLHDNSPVLLDFGAARYIDPDKTDPSTIVLKPGFAPIEQYSETNELKLGPWSDIYAISAVAYQLITGKMPPISVSRILRDDLKPLASFASPLSRTMMSVLNNGLSVLPKARPQSIGVFALALRAAARPPAPPNVPEHTDKQPIDAARKWLIAFMERAGTVAGATLTAARQSMAAIHKRLRAFWQHLSNTLLPGAIAALVSAKNAASAWFGRTMHAVVNFVRTHKKQVGLGTVSALVVFLFVYSFLSTPEVPEAPRLVRVEEPDTPKGTETPGDVPPIEEPSSLPPVILVEVGEHRVEPPLSMPIAPPPIQPPEAEQNPSETVLPPAPPPAPPVQRPSTPATNFGQITVKVKPWGNIFVNGKYIRTAPPILTLENLRPGTYQVEIRNESSKPYVRRVKLKAGDRVAVSHDF
jgi:serine/threonine protein kinase